VDARPYSATSGTLHRDFEKLLINSESASIDTYHAERQGEEEYTHVSEKSNIFADNS
jgi:hypothetical protein